MRHKFSLPATGEYFLLLLPLFFVFHGFNQNRAVVDAADAISLLLIYLLLTAIVCLFGVFIFKNWRKATIFSLCVMAFYFFFGAVHDMVKDLFGNLILTRYVFILPGVVVCTILLILFLKKTARKFNRLVRFTNVLLLVLITVEGFAVFNGSAPNTSTVKTNTGDLTVCDTCTKPDIYLIVADEYAGNTQLKEQLGFDNSAFIAALRQRGFYIDTNSRSNYNSTPYCMASQFQMNYLVGIEGRKGNKDDLNACYTIINHNPFTAYLKKNGYAIHNLSVFTVHDQKPPTTSMFLTVGKNAIDAHTFYGRLNRDIRFNTVTRFKINWEMKRFAKAELAKIESTLQKTEAVPATASAKPRLVYTHVMLPHFPYFLDSAGNMNDLQMLAEESWGRQKEYIGYLQYSNNRFLQLIDAILLQSKKPPVIIFLGDHGFRHFTVTPATEKYLFANMSAVYLPGGDYNQYYQGASTVNQFRILLNTIFQQKLSMLKDSTSYLP